jgi:uncharacterized membrane protein
MWSAFIITAVTVLLLDAVWLTLNFSAHSKLFAAVQKSPMTIRLLPAALVYVLIPAALTYFAIKTSKTVKESVEKGALMGLSMYGLYDLTNYSTLKGWTLEMTIKDTLWGTFACAVGAGSGFYFSR